MSGYTNFNKLNKVGNDGEQRFKEWLEKNKWTNMQHIDEVYEEEGLERDAWDWRATSPLGVTFTFEVKTQDECHDYGYYNPEQVQNFKPGGVVKSKADYYVTVNKKLGFGFIEMSVLKSIHYQIAKVVYAQSNYSSGKVIVTSYGDFQLYKTKYRNPAMGWKHPIYCRTVWKK